VNTFRAPAGATRLCPHCRAVILQSASSCPACRKHLKFEPGAAATPAPSFSALNLEGAVRHPNVGQPWEYSVLVSVKNDKGQIIDLNIKDPEQLKLIKKGDQIQATYTEAVAISLTPAAAKK